ncbi:DUF456 domain-containing protein [Fodinicola acaciae]|uniref:DUF456 domain-containing protein n=1 Tax=Fodinicola acaciae TaxID=2681555 RepID=UPI0013CFF7F2|nr:DUF456 domain-containing protein [Fodinicola acaciae]
MEALLITISSVLIVVGLVGGVIQVVPGPALCWVGVLVWVIFTDAGWGRWVVLVVATLLAIVGTIVKFAIPGKQLKESGVPTVTILAGIVLGIVGMFVIPVVGLFVGFVLGVFLAEALRAKSFSGAWPSTVEALKATGLSVLIELLTAFAIAVTFVLGVIFA